MSVDSSFYVSKWSGLICVTRRAWLDAMLTRRTERARARLTRRDAAFRVMSGLPKIYIARDLICSFAFHVLFIVVWKVYEIDDAVLIVRLRGSMHCTWVWRTWTYTWRKVSRIGVTRWLLLFQSTVFYAYYMKISQAKRALTNQTFNCPIRICTLQTIIW